MRQIAFLLAIALGADGAGIRAQQTWTGECQPGSTRPIKTTAAPPGWSLGPKGANVSQALENFPKGSRPGDGVVVVQPDTGYRRHGALPATSGGWDFLNDDNDPFDETDKGVLQFPSHGTRTGSVIISPPEFKLTPASTVFVSGVAPFATWIPLRVTNRVVLIDRAEYDIANVTSAIRQASGGNRSLVKKQADVISMSLGGTPNAALRAALAEAERNGVIVLAAAGNHTKVVVWPAQYKTVVSVTATNYDETLWSGSAYLPEGTVTIAAPGEAVWTAVSDRAGPTYYQCVEPGDGTSFAVATMAGVAALWISKHQNDAAFKALRHAGLVPAAFRKLVPMAARVPNDKWKTGWAPGIIDANRLLTLSLPLPKDLQVGTP